MFFALKVTKNDRNPIFGNYELQKVLVGHAEGRDHYTIKVILWPE